MDVALQPQLPAIATNDAFEPPNTIRERRSNRVAVKRYPNRGCPSCQDGVANDIVPAAWHSHLVLDVLYRRPVATTL